MTRSRFPTCTSAEPMLRLAVLRLASAHPDDQAWIRARLPQDALEKVDALRMEVIALGITDFSPWTGELEASIRQSLESSFAAEQVRVEIRPRTEHESTPC